MPVVFKEHFEFTDSHIEQEEHGDEFCPDVEFLVLFEGEVRVSPSSRPRAAGRSRTSRTASRTSVYTNLDNGKSLTFMSQGRAADRKIVDNDDGTITISFQFTGRTLSTGRTARGSSSTPARSGPSSSSTTTAHPRTPTTTSFSGRPC